MQSSNELKCLYFSLGVIKQATREFSDQNLLGEDGFGDIYRGNISINDYDYVVAVKRFHKESEIMFRYEIDRLSPFHHRNIISLLGYCEEEYEKILVYELLPNGSLYDYLLSGKHRVRNLTVAKRLEICIETANGLSYLHFGTRFIHGDVNTCNIFLDDNLVAKLLAPPFTSCLRGTEGYAAPECYDPSYIPNLKADVYAFGVVLLELLCERPAYKTLIVLALPSIIKGELPAFIPEHVKENISIECSLACANLVMACLDNDPHKRPSMNQVIDKLLLALQLQKQKLTRQKVDVSWNPACANFRLEDIKRATKKFAIDNLLGEAACWKSYRGYFGNRYNGVVSVKRINKELVEFGSYNFKQEVELLAGCNHVNVISLLGFCDEENENIIVHKFMRNGLLYDYLYNNHDETLRLTLKHRLDICVGVAHGLSYLHRKNIIHGNLDTFKIFLDHDLVPSISGMDMAFLNHPDNSSSNRIIDYKPGTEGYPAPECYEPDYKPSQQADVYAFGILLLEVLCEKPPWKSPVMLALEFAKKEELATIRHEPVEISTFEKCLKACEKLIRECVDVDPDKRPFMRQVVDGLESALKLQKNYENGKAVSHQLNNPSSSSSCQSFLLSDIKRATREFSHSNYLGGGGFGKVYKGNFSGDSYSGIVAVKRMTIKPEKGIPSFNKEKQLVLACDHINIISLVGYCIEDPEKILLYEFMPNGSLYGYLHEEDKKRAAQLTIEQRLEICIGVAKGLDYLHSRTDYVIIHSDLKSDNILLDQNLVPKISDFGLSRTRDAGPSTSKQITYHIQGTDGFIAPECHEPNYEASRKLDVYAYGVVLLEVLCEGKGWDKIANSALKFIQRRKFFKLLPDYVARHISSRCLLACQQLITECLDNDPDNRPDMNQVVTRLEEALRLERKYSEDHLLPYTDPKVFSSSSDRAVLYHKNKSVLLPRHYQYFMDDNFSALQLLEDYGKRVDYRNIMLDPLFTEQLENIYGWRKYSLPQLFIGGKHIGGIGMIRELHKAGTLQGMFVGVTDRDYRSPCWECHNMRFVECNQCFNSSFKGKKCPNGDCKECNENEWIPCPICSNNMSFEERFSCISGSCIGTKFPNGDCKMCNENGLIRCPICCSWQTD